MRGCTCQVVALAATKGIDVTPKTNSDMERRALIASFGDESVGHVVGSAEGFLVPLQPTQISVATEMIVEAISSCDEDS
jgi:hypothetical protein